MTTNTPGLLYAGGAMKSVATLPAWLVDHFGSTGSAEGAYDVSATLFRALDIRASTVAAGELKLYDADDSEIETHPLLDVLHNVNAEWNYSDLWRYTEAGAMVYGAGYWQKVRAGRRLSELFYLNPSTIIPTISPRGIQAFTQIAQITAGAQNAFVTGTLGGNQTFARQDVVYFRGAYDPRSDLLGRPPLKWAINAAMGEGAAEKYLNAFFTNGAVPAVVFATDKPMSDTEIEKAKAWWDRLFKSVANAFKTAFLGNGLKPYTVGSTIKDMELASTRSELRRTLSIVTGVPELLISATDSADLTPVDLAMKLLYFTTVIPRWKWYAETLNAELVTEYPDLVRAGAYLSFDTSNIEVLQESSTSRTDRIVGLVNAGIITRQKAAEELGYNKSDVPPEPTTTSAPVAPGQTAQPGQMPGQKPSADNPPAAQRTLAERDRSLWQRKALNALAKGKSASVTFASDALSASEHAEISAALSECKTAESVAAVFQRDAPPDDLAQIGRDLKAAIDRATEAML